MNPSNVTPFPLRSAHISDKGIEPYRKGGDGGEPPMIEARVAKLESDVEYIKKDIADIKLGMSEMRVELKSDISELRTELKGDIGEIRTHQRSDFKLLFGTLITITLSLAGIMAKGFGWL